MPLYQQYQSEKNPEVKKKQRARLDLLTALARDVLEVARQQKNPPPATPPDLSTPPPGVSTTLPAGAGVQRKVTDVQLQSDVVGPCWQGHLSDSDRVFPPNR